MTVNTIVTPSSQVDSILPGFITETYTEFVNFMTKADQSEERIGFSQDLLQNLNKYRDFNTYRHKIVETGILAQNITATDTELTLESGFGFPEENGILYIGDEIILYRVKTGNVFSELERGASGTVILPTFTSKGTYTDTVASAHSAQSTVTNVSMLFLVSMLETIYETYVPEIIPSRVAPEINNATLLENIREFFQSKGSKLGIKSLFKILFAENDVDVTYPGDRMIIPSKSTWNEAEIVRVLPLPSPLCPVTANLLPPDKFINARLDYYLEGYEAEDVPLATAVCEYAFSYPYEDEIQYELSLQKNSLLGKVPATPVTVLTKNLDINDTTVTVETTIGFPVSGVIHIGSEGIKYEYKSLNQFFGCTRGHVGVARGHQETESVFGSNLLRGTTFIDGIKYETYCWVLGLAERADVLDGGLLHKLNDDIYINDPGAINPREPVLSSIIENYGEKTVTQASLTEITDVTNLTEGVNSVYFDDEFALISTSGFPDYTIGNFSTDGSIGPNLTAQNITYAIPLSGTVEDVDVPDKGTNQIGVFIDGVAAYSEVSPQTVVQGNIAFFTVISEGHGYKNPTVLITPAYSLASATVVDGRVTGVSPTSVCEIPRYYTGNPEIRISSGENASFSIQYDLYGRITGVTVENGGLYYNDVPPISVVDSSGRGKGALLTATISEGSITAINVIQSGIDYNPATTEVVDLPVGSGAVVTATVQYYQYNRYQEVLQNPTWTFDSGNGFLYEAPSGISERSTYGYVCSPTQLRNKLDDNGTHHSPILGWALDGNPIYGPHGYENYKNDSDGIRRMRSGYLLQNNRSSIVPGGETTSQGLVPPPESTYPMGTFVQDYNYHPEFTNVDLLELQADSGDDITTESGLTLEVFIEDASGPYTADLDLNNGRICNTPEYPEELYPNGVYAYFVTINADQTPAFPYIIGADYHDAPVDWYLSWGTKGILPQKIKFGPIPYTPTRSLDASLFRRYRNPYLSDSKKLIDVNISTVSTGGVSSIVVENGLPATTMVGDLLYYNDEEEQGSGALGVVTFVDGEEVDYSFGSLLIAYLDSHRQKIDLSGNNISFTFVKDTYIRTWNDAYARVEKYNQETRELFLQTETLNHVIPNPDPTKPSFFDNLFQPVKLYTANPEILELGNVPLGSTTPNDVIVSYYRPTVGISGYNTEPGDLWWSIYDGRLFIYYEDNDSSQWVVTQPLGVTPYGDLASDTSLASDTAIVTIDSPGARSELVAGGNNTITISNIAPDQRSDNTPNKMGDLWWSQETGILYLWYTDGLQNLTATGTYTETNVNSYWVITDPAGIVPLGHGDESYAVDRIYPEPGASASLGATIYTGKITAMISDVAPTVRPDGSPLQLGNIFWSNATGKMYVYWSDGDSTQWTVCNPSGSITGEYAGDHFPGGDPDGPGPDPFSPIGQIPELPTQRLLWFDDLRNFRPGDFVTFQAGAPGVPETSEDSRIEFLGPNEKNYAVFIRGYNDEAIELPNGIPMVNRSRAIYTVHAKTDTKLDTGDEVIISGSAYPEVNGLHSVLQAGLIIPAVVTPVINDDGEMTDIILESGGKFYSRDFIISFTGGGGQAAFGFATVSPFSEGGSVISVSLINGGHNYISPPTPIYGREVANNVFFIAVSTFYGSDFPVSYVATGKRVTNKAAIIAIDSPGVDYTEIPPALGLYKKLSDRARVVVDSDGTSIGGVTVLSGGARYVNPTPIFYDMQGSGRGATGTAIVENGVVTRILMTTKGSGYIQPVVQLVEMDGKYISLTKEIGKITSLDVIDPGKKVLTDSSLAPELQIVTRCILQHPKGDFIEGSEVYQGTTDVQQVTATVVSYDDSIQQLTLEKVNGILKTGEKIRDFNGAEGIVRLQGEADCRIVISGTAEPSGRFINDTSMLSTKYAHIQDSYYYQWFSYNIQSPLQKTQYETLVNEIIHPSGFIQFSELDVNTLISVPFDSKEVEFGKHTILDSGRVPPVIISTDPPEDPAPGNLWYNDVIGTLFIYYVDSDSAQWVDTNPDDTYPRIPYSSKSTLLPGDSMPAAIGGEPPRRPAQGDLWFNSDDGILFVYYQDVDSGQWVDCNPRDTPVYTPPSFATVPSGYPVTVSEELPLDPEKGDLWYDTVNGVLYVWYVDPDSAEWVDCHTKP